MPKASVRPDILTQLNCAKETLESLHSGGLDLAADIEAVNEAIDLITKVHRLVDGKEVDSGTLGDLMEALVEVGLDVRDPNEIGE